MDRLVRFVECLVPISHCNLHCSYCYVVQQNRRDIKADEFQCTPSQIGKAFSPERWGGIMLVNLCGFGETLLCRELPEIAEYILKQGHYVNITNNGTITGRINQLLEMPTEQLSRLCFSFSLHYVELKRLGLLDVFASNVLKVKKAGCSFLIQLNLADEYIECIDEIKSYCIKHFGAYPQIALTRKEGSNFEIFSSRSDEEYVKYGKSFHSPLFDMTLENFRNKRREFCYAGDWTYTLNLATGDLSSCYFSNPFYNIFKNPEERVKKNTVGNHCGSPFCINSSHFMSLGVIPEIKCPTYVALRDRNGEWYTQKTREFLSQKLYDNHKQYGVIDRTISNLRFGKKEKLKLYLKRGKRKFLKVLSSMTFFN